MTEQQFALYLLDREYETECVVQDALLAAPVFVFPGASPVAIQSKLGSKWC